MITDTHIKQESVNSSNLDGLLEVDDPTLLDLLLLLRQYRALIAKATVGAAIVALVVAFVLPNRYTATTLILPPPQSQSSLSAMFGQLGALSGIVGGKDALLGLKNPADLYVGILKSRSIADGLVLEFDLKKFYNDKTMADARNDLNEHAIIEILKDGMIAISFEDKDPVRAAAIANAYVGRLYQATQRLAISEASQRRLFYEKQLADEKDALVLAEVELKKTQERTGLIQLGSQADAIIRASAMLKAQITAKEVQLQGLRSFNTEQSPSLMRVEQELAALKLQMAKLENDKKLGGGNIQIPTGKVPEVGLEYARRFREVKYHEVLFEILAKQYEAAKIDEGKNAPVVQVVDTAIPPDKRSGPPRSLIVVMAALASALLSCCYVWLSAGIRRIKEDPEQRKKKRTLQEDFLSQGRIRQ